MRVLVIEDNRDTALVLCEELDARGHGCELVASRAAALAAIDAGEPLDLVICDLSIPTVDDALDESVDHGLFVLSHVRSVAPGVPILAFSGYGTAPGVAKSLVDNADRQDLFGVGHDEQVLTFFDKAQLAECLDEVDRCGRELEALGEIELSEGFTPVGLSGMQERVVQIYARRRSAKVVHLRALDGGLTAARVVRARLEGIHGQHVATLVGKLADLETVDIERMGYENHVAGALPLGSYPSVVGLVRAGADRTAGLFYELGGDYGRSLADLLGDDQAAAANVVRRLAELSSPWREGAPAVNTSVGALREAFIASAGYEGVCSELGDAFPFDVENQQVQARICTAHGDLHALNVLLNEASEPLFIDFGRVQHAPASTDPVTMELSLGFHPALRELYDWPTPECALQFFNLAEYLVGSPVPDFVRVCREWSLQPGVGAGTRELAAVVLGYSIRQLMYPGTSKELACAYAMSAAEVLLK